MSPEGDTDVPTTATATVLEPAHTGNGVKELPGQPTTETADLNHITKLKEEAGGDSSPVKMTATAMEKDTVIGGKDAQVPQDM